MRIEIEKCYLFCKRCISCSIEKCTEPIAIVTAVDDKKNETITKLGSLEMSKVQKSRDYGSGTSRS